MFRKAGEFQMSFSGGNGFEGQSAVSVSKHIGLLANYSYIDRKSDDLTDVNDSQKHTLLEGAVGYFENTESVFIEIFAGYGQGQGTTNNESIFGYTHNATGKYNKFFVQPAIGFNQRSMHVSFIPRVSIIDFTAFDDGTTRMEVSKRPQAFFEPAVVGRFNFADNHLFFLYQGGVSIPMANDAYFDHRAFLISAGLGFRFGGIKLEKDKKVRSDL
jgi:hypothetical protein